jgi:hypothetical protein
MECINRSRQAKSPQKCSQHQNAPGYPVITPEFAPNLPQKSVVEVEIAGTHSAKEMMQSISDIQPLQEQTCPVAPF